MSLAIWNDIAILMQEGGEEVAAPSTLEQVKVWSQFAHPIFMWVLLVMALYALYLGLQAKRIRTTEDKDLRKELVAKKVNLQHFQVGSWLLACVVLGTLGGMAVTYINNGKLFVGPHLLAGLGMVGLITLSVAMVPYMQQGNVAARTTHVSLNLVLLVLFSWQAVTGMQIVYNIVTHL